MFKVSVIIPTHNRLSTLPRALESVCQQAHFVDEIIVVDDGSSDNTCQYIQTHYPQARLITQTQHGVSKARNVGIKAARNEWIALLDSDDEWLPHKLQTQFELLDKNKNFLVCHTDEMWVRNGKRVNPMNKHKKQGGWIFSQCLPLCAISPSSVVIHRSIFEKVGYFDESLPACEDYDLWLRICNRFPVLFVEQACIKKYGGHEDQLSRQYWGMDRFRIAALTNMLDGNELSAENRLLTLNTLKEKVRVYCLGANKRGKSMEVSQYMALLEKYGVNP